MPVLIDRCRGCSGTAGVRDARRPAGSHGSSWRFSSRGTGTSRPNQACGRTHPQGRLAEPPDQDIAGRAESGAVGLGLIGTLLAQTSRALASGIAFAGAGFSVYSTFLARGEDVVLPANTPLKVSLKARGGEAQRVRRGLH